MADISQIKLPNGDTYNLVDETSGFVTSDLVATNWVNGSTTGSVRTTSSMAEDSSYTIGSYATAEGGGTKATGNGSHAEGSGTTASGEASHAEGGGTTANGLASHAEGGATTASGQNSHAEGGGTTASGYCSHAEGGGTIANHASQHVFGEFNVEDPSRLSGSYRGTYVEIVGNGSSSARSNARTLDWSGNEILAGKLTIGANPTAAMDVVTKQYMENQGYLTLSTLPIYDGTVE